MYVQYPDCYTCMYILLLSKRIDNHIVFFDEFRVALGFDLVFVIVIFQLRVYASMVASGSFCFSLPILSDCVNQLVFKIGIK